MASTNKKGSDSTTQVRIGISESSQELSFECDLGREEVETIVSTALNAGTTLSLTDTKGHVVLVPAAKVAFVYLGASSDRKIGFATN